MEADAKAKGTELRVDGGASANNLLMQFQADIFNFRVVRPKLLETTALGAAYLAGLAVGFWNNLEDLKDQWEVDQVFKPIMELSSSRKIVDDWHKAVSRSKNWIEE